MIRSVGGAASKTVISVKKMNHISRLKLSKNVDRQTDRLDRQVV